MLDLYIQNKNALTGLESALRIAIGNANNFNTPGYKYISASFTTTYTEALSSGTTTTNPKVLGQGMMLGSTSTDFSQGPIANGTKLDIAIVGEGFFVLSTGSDENSLSATNNYYTRAGRFHTDSANDYIVDSFGRKVYGFKTDSDGNVISSQMEPIRAGGTSNVGFVEGGVLVTDPGEDTQRALYKVAMTSFQNKEGLVAVTGTAYKNTLSSGERFEPGTSGNSLSSNSGTVYGDILPESLESSNVDIPRVALDMNRLNRMYTATQGTIDDITKVFNETLKVLK